MKKTRIFGNFFAKFVDLVGRNLINDPQNHFADARKMVNIGSQSDRELDDYHLSRFACYLIAQNGDPRKPEIAEAQINPVLISILRMH